jgi:hypothetical protein
MMSAIRSASIKVGIFVLARGMEGMIEESQIRSAVTP